MWGNRVKGSLDHPHEVPWAKQLYIHYLTKRGEPFTWETKCWLSKKGYPHSRIVLLWWYAHLPGKANFVHSAVSTRSRGDIRACASTAVSSWLEKWAQLFSHISARLSWLGQEGEPLLRTTFLHVKRGLYTRHLHFTRRKSRNSWWFLKIGGQGSGGPKIGTFFSENTVTLWKDKII